MRPTSIAGGRLQLGISRGSPEQVIDGYRHFGYVPGEGEDDGAMARRHARCSSSCCPASGFAEPNPRPMFPESARPPAPGAALARPARPHLVGIRHERDRGVGGAAGHEHADLHPEVRRERPAAPSPAGGADRRISRGMARGRAPARAARLGQPQHLPAGRRSRPGLLRARAAGRATRSATWTRRRGRSSAAPTPPSRTSSSSSWQRTRPSRLPTRCCSRSRTS